MGILTTRIFCDLVLCVAELIAVRHRRGSLAVVLAFADSLARSGLAASGEDGGCASKAQRSQDHEPSLVHHRSSTAPRVTCPGRGAATGRKKSHERTNDTAIPKR